MKRLLLLLIGTLAVVGCMRPMTPGKEQENGNVTIMVVSSTEAPRILEDVTEEMLIEKVISDNKREDGERNKSKKNNYISESILVLSTGKSSARNEDEH